MPMLCIQGGTAVHQDVASVLLASIYLVCADAEFGEAVSTSASACKVELASQHCGDRSLAA